MTALEQLVEVVQVELARVPRKRRARILSAEAVLVLRALVPGVRYRFQQVAALVGMDDHACGMLCARMYARGDLLRHGTRRYYTYSAPAGKP